MRDEPTTQTMKISDVNSRLSRLIDEVYRGATRVFVETSGIPAAAVVSVADLQRLARLDKAWAAVDAVRGVS